jgi:hypothetical protein
MKKRCTKPADIGGYLGLAAAVLQRALIDARRGDTSAVTWLLAGEGLDIATLAGMDNDYWQDTIRAEISAERMRP